MDFGNTGVGKESQLPILVRNTGTGSITISGVSVTGAAYKLSGLKLPEIVKPGQASSFTIIFTPKSSGTLNGTVSLTSDATNSPQVEPLSGTGVQGHYVTLSWTASKSSGVLGYDVYRGTTSGGPYQRINSYSIHGTSYTDQGVVAGETYYYVTTAVTNAGQSGYSNQATATVP